MTVMKSWALFWWEQSDDPLERDAAEIVDVLRREAPDVTIHMRCFNEEEANAIRAKLPPECTGRVIFTWLHWPAR